jgi:hypothetical protein
MPRTKNAVRINDLTSQFLEAQRDYLLGDVKENVLRRLKSMHTELEELIKIL